MSMGWAGARKLRRAVDGLGRVLAIELLTATRALDLRCDGGSLHPARESMARHVEGMVGFLDAGAEVFDLSLIHI